MSEQDKRELSAFCDEFKKRDADGQRLAMALMAAYDAGKAAGEKKKEQEALSFINAFSSVPGSISRLLLCF